MAKAEQSPIEPRPLAVAGADRIVKEYARSSFIHKAVHGIQYIHLSGQRREQGVATIANRNEQLIPQRGNDAVSKEIVLDREIALVDIFLSNDNQSEALKSQNKGLTRHYTDLFFQPVAGIVTAYTFKEFDTAVAMAEDHGVTVADVYGQKELYRDAVRKIYGSPQEHAEFIIAPVLREQMRDAAGQYALAHAGIMQVSSLIEEGKSVDVAAEIAQRATDIYQESPQFKKDVAVFLNDFREQYYVAAACDIERFWGPEGMEYVSGSVKDGMDYYMDAVASRGVAIEIDKESIRVNTEQ